MDEINRNLFRARLPLVLVLVLLFVTSVGLMIRMPWSGRVATAIFDLLHAPVFCIVAWTLMWLVRPTIQKKNVQLRLVLALVLILFGAVAEFAQQFVGRNTSWHDLVANCMGVAAGYLIFAWLVRRQQQFAFVPLVAGIIILLAAVRPAVTELIDCARVRSQFPLLDSFENGHAGWHSSEAIVETIHDPQLATHGDYVLRWHLEAGQYPGCQMYEPPRDWSGFERLEFDIRLASDSPVDELTVVLKLHDRPHRTEFGYDFEDRFHRDLSLFRGEWQQIAIDLVDIETAPATRTMDLTQMDVLQIFAIDQGQSATVFIDHVRLTKRTEP